MILVPAQKHPGHPGDFIAAQGRQHADRIPRVRMIDPDRLFDYFNLSFQSVIGKSRAPAGHFFGRQIQQHGGHGTGSRCVADAHFPDYRDPVSPVPQIPHHLHARLQRLFRLFPRHRRTLRDIGRSRADPPVDGSFHFGEHAHINGKHIRPGCVSHQVDVSCSLRDAARHQCRHFTSGLADPFLHNTVVAAEHKCTPLVNPHIRGLRNPGDLNHHVLQPAKGMKRLRDAVPASAGLFLYVHSSASSIRRTTSLISSKRPVRRS